MIATTRILMPVYDGMTMGTLEDPEKREALVKSLLEGLDCDLPEVFPDVIHRVDTNMILDMDPDRPGASRSDCGHCKNLEPEKFAAQFGVFAETGSADGKEWISSYVGLPAVRFVKERIPAQ